PVLRQGQAGKPPKNNNPTNQMASYLIVGSTGREPPCIPYWMGSDIFQLTLLVNPNSLTPNSLTKVPDLPAARTPDQELQQWVTMELA
ncbi:MAG: hypothetical protein VW472_02165, partial [Candidatus Puniceispirillum sp.]